MQTSRFLYDNLKNTVVDTTKTGLVEFFVHHIFWIIFDFFTFYLSIAWLVLFIITDFNWILFSTIFILLIALDIFTAYIILIKFYKFKVKEFTIYSNKVTEPIKLVFISDIHVGNQYYSTKKRRLRKLINEVNKIDKDLLLIGGDFLTYSFNEDLLKIFGEFTGQKIAVYGNHDVYYKAKPGNSNDKYPNELISVLKDAGIKTMLNESDSFKIRGQEIVIGGIPDLFDLNFDLDKTFEGKSSDKFKILLSHNPDIWEFITEEDNIDLILSGHLHSGQIHTKVTGPILPMPSKYKHHTQGIYKLNTKTSLLISQGVGYSGTRFKIGVDNEIMIINLSPIRP